MIIVVQVLVQTERQKDFLFDLLKVGGFARVVVAEAERLKAGGFNLLKNWVGLKIESRLSR
jgi:hypothetical protein